MEPTRESPFVVNRAYHWNEQWTSTGNEDQNTLVRSKPGNQRCVDFLFNRSGSLIMHAMSACLPDEK